MSTNITNFPPNAEHKKAKKQITKRKKIDNTNTNVYMNDLLNFNNKSLNIKSIKIPEKFEEKEKLYHSLKLANNEIDSLIKNLTSKREYYTEIIDMLDKEIKEKRQNEVKHDSISIIQEELYSKYLIKYL